MSAPAAVTVEVRSSDRRVFRLTHEIGEKGLVLTKPAPFEPGRPVRVRLTLPGSRLALTLDATITVLGEPGEEDGQQGGCGLEFLNADADTRATILKYVLPRLGLKA